MRMTSPLKYFVRVIEQVCVRSEYEFDQRVRTFPVIEFGNFRQAVSQPYRVLSKDGHPLGELIAPGNDDAMREIALGEHPRAAQEQAGRDQEARSGSAS